MLVISCSSLPCKSMYLGANNLHRTRSWASRVEMECQDPHNSTPMRKSLPTSEGTRTIWEASICTDLLI